MSSRPSYRHFFRFLLFLLISETAFADTLIVEPDAGRAPILAALQQAQTDIDLAIYGLTDPQCIHALIDEKNNGKNVRVLIESKPYKNETENAPAMKRLQAAHIDVQSPDPLFRLIHQKTFLIDHHLAIIMTFNLTKATFKKERNFALVITDPEELQEIERVYASDWAHQKVTVHHPYLIWSPDNSRDKIVRFLRSAKQDIKIYAQSIMDTPLLDTLTKLANSGIKIDIISSTDFSHDKRITRLQKAGAIIHLNHHYIIHAKVIMIDGEKAMLGSTNLTRPSIEENRELSVITSDPFVMNSLLNTFQKDLQESGIHPDLDMSGTGHHINDVTPNKNPVFSLSPS